MHTTQLFCYHVDNSIRVDFKQRKKPYKREMWMLDIVSNIWHMKTIFVNWEKA